MADMQSPQHPMEVLPAMLNLVLLQTSNILLDPESRNLKQAGLTGRKITGIVTSANQRFHHALDEIEIEILHAKAIMERDLRLIRKKRAERDRERDRALGIPSPSSPAKAINDNHQQNVDASNGKASAAQMQGPDGEDLLIAGDSAKANPLGLHDGSQGKTSEGEVIGAEQGMPQDSENSVGLAITMPSDTITTTDNQANSTENQPEDVPPAPEASLDLPDASDLDFESMFNDTDLVGGNDINFEDIGFPMDAAVNQDILNNNTLLDTNMSNTDITNLASTSNEDINSSLPGLGNFVNADTDFSNINMPATSTQPEIAQGAPVANMGASTSNPAKTIPADTTNFEELFGVNFELDTAGGDEMGDGTLGDFDDFQWD
ncbi:hypothetical protein N7G274_000263 [Stereocaulon virgatum]|uniref:Uncharacterized protein n=1 Tax=Stereocaulon virgatum TaxID=373712 RepID=A0ABR4ARL6_9LECA